MRASTILLGAALATLFAGEAVAQPRYRLTIGEAVPDLELPRADGGRVRLRALRGQPLAISFYSVYCEPCRRELPTLRRVLERVNRGLPIRHQVLGTVVSLDSRAKTQTVARQNPSLRWLLDPEGKARAQFDPRTYPCTFLVDAGGRVRHINRGFGAGYEARIERWLRGLLSSGTDPARPE